MTDDNFELSRRKVLGSMGMMGVAGAAAGFGTSAYFSDTEQFLNNALAAGELDMKAAYSAYYSDWSADEGEGVDVNMWDGGPDTTGTAGDLTPDYTGLPLNDNWLIEVDDPDQFLDNTRYLPEDGERVGNASCDGGTDADQLQQPVIELEDIKPGDFGEVTFDFALCDNPGYVWLTGELLSCAENGVTEPEADDPDENENEPRPPGSDTGQSSLWPLAALAGVPALGGGDDSSGSVDGGAEESETAESSVTSESDGHTPTLREGAAAAGMGAAGLAAASGIASAEQKGDPPDPDGNLDVSTSNSELSVTVGELGSSGFEFGGDSSTVYFEEYGLRDGESGTHVESSELGSSNITDPFPSSVPAGDTAESTISYPVPTAGGTSVDLEVNRNVTLDDTEPILRIEYVVTNPAGSGGTYNDLRLSQYVDYDIAGISNNTGRYFFDPETNCEFIWQETTGSDIFAGFTAEEQSVTHGLTTYNTGADTFGSDDISSILNEDDIHPDTGTTDVELIFEWSLGELAPGETESIRTSFVYNQEGQEEFEAQICQESPGPAPEPTQCADVELLDVVQAAAWVDDGNNYQNDDEEPTFVGSLREVLNELTSGSGLGLMGDMLAQEGGGTGRNCFSAETTHSVGFAWWVPVDHGNEIQTDSVRFDLGFYTEQCRHNDGSGIGTTASVNFEDQESDGSSVLVDSVTLPDGGYVVIHESDGGAPGPVLGNSSYLSAGTSTDVAVTLDSPISEDQELIAMAHTDDGDQQYEFPNADGPYTTNGSPVIDAALITIVS